MDFLQAIILGILQGITEWLPISSQGQTVATAITLFGIPAGEALKYAIVLHIGTLIAAIVYFRKELMQYARAREMRVIKFVALVLVFSAVTGIPAYILFKNLALNWAVLFLIGIFLVVSGLLQQHARKWKPRLGEKYAIGLGLAQGLAVLPGISRSGITTAVLLLEDFEPEKAFRISFLISIPSVLAGEIFFGLFEGIGIVLNPTALVAIAVAAIVGYISIDVLLRFARRINFAAFCILFGAIYILMGLIQII